MKPVSNVLMKSRIRAAGLLVVIVLLFFGLAIVINRFVDPLIKDADPRDHKFAECMQTLSVCIAKQETDCYNSFSTCIDDVATWYKHTYGR